MFDVVQLAPTALPCDLGKPVQGFVPAAVFPASPDLPCPVYVDLCLGERGKEGWEVEHSAWPKMGQLVALTQLPGVGSRCIHFHAPL